MQNIPKSFRKFKKVPFALSLVFVALSCTLLFLVFQKIDENKTKFRATELEWQKEASRRLELKSLGILLRQTTAERAEIGSHFARPSNVVPFLDSVEEMARSVGADPEVVAVETPPGSSDLFVVVRADGRFESIYKFIELLENSPYELEFTLLNIERKNLDDTGAEWGAYLKMKLLSYLP